MDLASNYLVDEILHVHAAVLADEHRHHLHSRHLGRGRVGPVSRERDQTHVALGLTRVLEVGHDGPEAWRERIADLSSSFKLLSPLIKSNFLAGS